MLKLSVTVGSSFQGCWEELVKYQTCLKFVSPFPTLVSDPNYIYIAAGLSVNLTACRFLPVS